MISKIKRPPDEEFNVVFLDIRHELFLVFCCEDCVEAMLGEDTPSESIFADELYRVTGKYCGGFCVNCGCEVGGIPEDMQELFQ